MFDVLKNKRVQALMGGFMLLALVLLIWGGGGDTGTIPAVPSSPAAQLLSVSPAPDAGASAALGQDLLAALALLRTLQLDVGVFDDPAYESLSDWGKDIPPQPIGRRNPFAPLGAGHSTGAEVAEAPAVSGTVTPIPETTSVPPPIPDNEPVWDFSNIDFSF